MEKVSAMLKGGGSHKQFCGSFNTEAWSFSDTDGEGRKTFHSLKGGAQKVLSFLEGGVQKVLDINFPILYPPPPH